MTLIAMPTGSNSGIRSIKWTQPVWGGYVVRSGWTGHSAVGNIGRVTQGWTANVEVTPGNDARNRAWQAFFAQLHGPVNSFWLRATPKPQIASSSAVTLGAYPVTLQFVYLSGLSHGSASVGLMIAAAGSLMTFVLPSGERQLVVLTQDLVADALGNAACQFDPPLREALSPGAVVELYQPYAEVRLTQLQLGWLATPGIATPAAFSCEEIL